MSVFGQEPQAFIVSALVQLPVLLNKDKVHNMIKQQAMNRSELWYVSCLLIVEAETNANDRRGALLALRRLFP